jgi:hypothetical protein
VAAATEKKGGEVMNDLLAILCTVIVGLIACVITCEGCFRRRDDEP